MMNLSQFTPRLLHFFLAAATSSLRHINSNKNYQNIKKLGEKMTHVS